MRLMSALKLQIVWLRLKRRGILSCVTSASRATQQRYSFSRKRRSLGCQHFVHASRTCAQFYGVRSLVSTT